MTRRTLTATLALLALIAAVTVGCGSDDDAPADSADESTESTPETSEVAGDADPEAVEVIADWADALRSGDVEGAAEYFAVPSTAENGPLLVRIQSQADAVRFNESLPCGARLIRADGSGGFTTATFELTERPGAGACGAGTGGTAKTAFVIRDGEIVEWRRVGADPEPSPGQAV